LPSESEEGASQQGQPHAEANNQNEEMLRATSQFGPYSRRDTNVWDNMVFLECSCSYPKSMRQVFTYFSF